MYRSAPTDHTRSECAGRAAGLRRGGSEHRRALGVGRSPEGLRLRLAVVESA